jgi:hypothetical protein
MSLVALLAVVRSHVAPFGWSSILRAGCHMAVRY